jgi:hypothetical protein
MAALLAPKVPTGCLTATQDWRRRQSCGNKLLGRVDEEAEVRLLKLADEPETKATGLEESPP